jgi:hypothetical protein
MNKFLRYLPEIIVLALAALITWQLPEDKRVQIVAPVIVGIIMFSLNSILGRPNVIIEGLSGEIFCSVSGNGLSCWTSGMIVNNSQTGEGEIKELTLIIILENSKHLDIAARHGDPDIIGFRVKPNGIFPDKILQFESSLVSSDMKDIIKGKPAQIRLGVVGQGIKQYKSQMAK